MIFQKISIQEQIGQNVIQLKKLETKLTVDLAGLSVLFPLCQTDSVLLQDKLNKQEFHQRIYQLVAKLAVWVAMEVSYPLLGTTLFTLDQLPEVTTVINQLVNHILSKTVTTIVKEDTDLAQLLVQLQNAKNLAKMDIQLLMIKILKN